MTLTELNENLREIYVESYTHSEVSEFIFRPPPGSCTGSSAPISRS